MKIIKANCGASVKASKGIKAANGGYMEVKKTGFSKGGGFAAAVAAGAKVGMEASAKEKAKERMQAEIDAKKELESEKKAVGAAKGGMAKKAKKK